MSWKDHFEKRKLLSAFIFILIFATLSVAYYGNTYITQSSQSNELNSRPTVSDLSLRNNKVLGDNFNDSFGPIPFDMNGSDVMVFLHMQKTGGTMFGRHLVSNLDIPKECEILPSRKKRNCLRPNSDTESWLFSRYSTGWLCGLHAGWTELHDCVDDKLNEIEDQVKERKYFYITILREPIARYLSEWKHVARGATWKKSVFICNNKSYNIPKCYEGSTWSGVSLEEFLSCPYNLAPNRQTRMIADLRLANCYERWLDQNLTPLQVNELENAMLASAKENLKNMTFFGLVEEQLKTQALFEYAFPFKFKKKFVQLQATRASSYEPTMNEMVRMKKLNDLDIKLYEFASELLEMRYRSAMKVSHDDENS